MPRIAILAVALLSYIYCVGYASFFLYFGVVAGDAWWINIPPEDLLVRGVFSLMFTSAKYGFFIFCMFLVIMLYPRGFKFLYERLCVRFEVLKNRVVQGILALVAIGLLVIGFSKVFLDLFDQERRGVADMLDSEEVDTVCMKSGGGCFEGKVLYSTDKGYVVYVGNVQDGALRLIPDSVVSHIDLGWSEWGKEAVVELVE
ncbi:hypothetical protein [Halomonas koreensis]|uniref:Uncharacterized protein n=1 Tax=Halomonas koreensis TaxID=245385 RepID=A0ABU1G6N1_9GAMM|nr:hypothetical protein [Halomonas koreensis]MDR5868099.1 hypothetical protein [Halomonas koreensis]